MTRGKPKVAATRHAKHEWSLKRKVLAVTLSITLLGLGTPAVSFADSAADQQSKAVEAQETTSAVSAQEQAPASAEPAQQVVASAAALGGAAVDNDVAVDAQAEGTGAKAVVDGAADNAATPASNESASGVASKNVAPAPASSDDQPSDKASASTEAASKDATPASETKDNQSDGLPRGAAQPEISGEGSVVVGATATYTVKNFKNTNSIQWVSDNTNVATVDENGVVKGVAVGMANITAYAGSQSATKQIEVKRDESGNGYYVYLYTKVEGNTSGLALTPNANGWYTIGRVWVDGITSPTWESAGYATSGDNYNAVMNALKDSNNVDLYGVNSINLEDIDWAAEGKQTGLKVASGATDYDSSSNLTWHLDGYVNFDKVGFGSIIFHYKEAKSDNTEITLAEDKTVTAKATGDKFDISKEIISIEGYSYHEAAPSSVIVEAGTTKVVTLYYKKINRGKVGYYLADSTATWTAPADTVFADNQKWYYNYGFAKGDTVKVTDSKPTATGKEFIGWLDKERGDQAAAIRKHGDTIKYIYDKGQTYTLDALWASLAVTGYSGTYDGQEHGLKSADVAINEGSDLAQEYQEQAKRFIKQGTILYSADDGETWSAAAPKYKDAGIYPVKVKVDVTVDGQIKTLEASANIEIAPATLTVTTPSDSRPYNGQPLTAAGTIEGFVNGETAGFATTGSQTAVGESKNSYDLVWNGSAKKSNYKIVENLGELTVTPVEAKVTVTVKGNTGTKPYNGAEQSVGGYTFVSADNPLYAEADVSFSGDAVAKGTDAGTYPMGLAASQFSNANENFANVEFVVEDGWLEITAGAIDQDNVAWTLDNLQKKYDGSTYRAGTATAVDGHGNALTVEYSADGESWTKDPATITAKDYSDSKLIQLRATGPNYAEGEYAYSDEPEQLIIGKRVLTLTSASDEKPYDGNPLVRNSQADVAVTGDGFAEGEGAVYDITGSQTQAGSSKNGFTYELKANTKAENYQIAKAEGDLTVKPVEAKVTVTVKGNTGTKPYNGAEQSVGGYTFVSADNPLYAEADVSFSGDAVAKGTDAGTYPMGLAASQFSNANENFANVEFVVEDGSIVIDPATLTVTTPNATRVYNGQPLTAAGTIEGFVNGETAGFTTTGSQAVVGESDNTYAIDWEAADATAKQSNYTIVEKLGTLKVTPNTTSIVVTPKGGTKVYDGTPLESAGVDEIVGLPKDFALTAEVVGSVTDAGYAKASIKSFVITNADGDDVTDQFVNVATGEATLVVTPRPVTVASADATKVYNGTELVKHEAKVSDGELVEGEEFDYEFFGTQTDAGVSDNTFAAKPGNDATKLENYEITYDRGVLTVTPAPYSVTTESATKVYDGTALTAGGKIEGLLEGETVNLKVTGSQTKVGASENTYTIEWTGAAKESNYKLESESIGTLTVTAAPDSPTSDDQSKDQGVFNGANSGLVQTGDATGIYGVAAIVAAAVAAFVSLLAVRRRKE